MDQPVKDALFLIEPVHQLREHGVVTRLVGAVDPVRDEVGELDQTAGLAVDEEWHLGVGGERADGRARGRSPFPPAQHGGLNGGLELEATLVGDHDAAMAVALRGEPSEHPVAPREEFLVGAFVRVVAREGTLVEGNREERGRTPCPGQPGEQQARDVVDQPFPTRLRNALPAHRTPAGSAAREALRTGRRRAAARRANPPPAPGDRHPARGRRSRQARSSANWASRIRPRRADTCMHRREEEVGRRASRLATAKRSEALAARMAMIGQPRARCQARRSGGGRRIDQRRKRSSMRACPSRAIRSSRIRWKSSRVRPPIWLAWHSTASSHRSRCSVTSTV